MLCDKISNQASSVGLQECQTIWDWLWLLDFGLVINFNWDSLCFNWFLNSWPYYCSYLFYFFILILFCTPFQCFPNWGIQLLNCSLFYLALDSSLFGTQNLIGFLVVVIAMSSLYSLSRKIWNATPLGISQKQQNMKQY